MTCLFCHDPNCDIWGLPQPYAWHLSHVRLGPLRNVTNQLVSNHACHECICGMWDAWKPDSEHPYSNFYWGANTRPMCELLCFPNVLHRCVFFPSGKCCICFARACKLMCTTLQKTPNNRNKSILTRLFKHCSNMESIYTMYHTATETHFWVNFSLHSIDRNMYVYHSSNLMTLFQSTSVHTYWLTYSVWAGAFCTNRCCRHNGTHIHDFGSNESL